MIDGIAVLSLVRSFSNGPHKTIAVTALQVLTAKAATFVLSTTTFHCAIQALNAMHGMLGRAMPSRSASRRASSIRTGPHPGAASCNIWHLFISLTHPFRFFVPVIATIVVCFFPLWGSNSRCSLLGPLNVASVLGVWVLNIVFLVSALYLMQADPEYVPWPARWGLAPCPHSAGHVALSSSA